MADVANGELVPTGGGDTIPLLRPVMTVGRRDMCDIKLEFPNISGIHCELYFRDGYWSVRDLNSTNGIKVNGLRVQSRPLKPGDEIAIGKRRYTIQYNLAPSAQQELEALLAEDEDMFSKSLLERAGLSNTPAPRSRPGPSRGPRPTSTPRIDLDDDD